MGYFRSVIVQCATLVPAVENKYLGVSLEKRGDRKGEMRGKQKEYESYVTSDGAIHAHNRPQY